MKTFFAILFALISPFAYGGNAAPLGMELGVATLSQVKQQVGSKTRLTETGINKYSNGRMLEGNGNGLEIDGLSKIVFIFDASDKLVGELLTLPKADGSGNLQNGGFQKTLTALSGKYKLVEKRVPFVGNAYAKLKQGDSVIELDAPHMSFDMELRYMMASLQKAFLQQSSSDKAKNEHNQANKL